MSSARGRRTKPAPFRPAERDVEQLIEKAARHPLGTEFLVEGALDAVSATFACHAFTVEHARQRLRDR